MSRSLAISIVLPHSSQSQIDQCINAFVVVVLYDSLSFLQLSQTYHTMSPIHTCPPELHSYIAYLACLTDHGPSVRSLNLVSRYFRRISRPFLYHSIIATGTQIILLLDKTLGLEGDTPPAIRHLFLASSLSPTPNAMSGGLVQAVHRILTRSSPSLYTLTVDFSNANAESTLVFSRLFRLSFPHLRELTVSGFYPNPAAAFILNRFPRLTRLHLHGNRNPHGLLQMGTLPTAFPYLTHLRISGLSMAVSFAVDLEEALKALLPTSSCPPTSSLVVTSGVERGDNIVVVSGDDRRSSTTLPAFFLDSSSSLSPPILQFPSTLSCLVVQPAPVLSESMSGMSSTTLGAVTATPIANQTQTRIKTKIITTTRSPSTSPRNASALSKDTLMMAKLEAIARTYGREGVGGVKFELIKRDRVSTGDLRLAWAERVSWY